MRFQLRVSIKRYSCQYFATPSGTNKKFSLFKSHFETIFPSLNKQNSFFQQLLYYLRFLLRPPTTFEIVIRTFPSWIELSRILITLNSLGCRGHTFLYFVSWFEKFTVFQHTKIRILYRLYLLFFQFYFYFFNIL